MKITTRARYSLRAMIDIALNEGSGPVPASGIAQRQRLSRSYLERILKQLVTAGLAKSKKGPGGGYTLTRVPDKISLEEIFRASGEELAAVPCIGKKCGDSCPLYKFCPARPLWSGLESTVERYLKQHSLAEFLKWES
ncbi:hypothetical protein CH330_01860 [candidate division WOR-3 bacterium JGI_Cruoil_03_51_56]|uniref:Rrf2 family transcriptional regulator n=1 Tax=candidate division WOR-3 bacterium JGI_Cruoil_03_51_56 TaxID=1973747 RepID=A0A235BSU8_UNCW3|nr:MAG: hypothetical protein CH330_06015 [candidate division WOR-3 bacterium JGI_Cruoil_03_51_56]OYD16806.1 MAG: hypothetical protein CH330_01860 [candidate division WOR-3 bacterium JGI_Cruoil_03_51_56]